MCVSESGRRAVSRGGDVFGIGIARRVREGLGRCIAKWWVRRVNQGFWDGGAKQVVQPCSLRKQGCW